MSALLNPFGMADYAERNDGKSFEVFTTFENTTDLARDFDEAEDRQQ